MIDIADNLFMTFIFSKTEGEKIMSLKAMSNYFSTLGLRFQWDSSTFSNLLNQEDFPSFCKEVVDKLIVPFIDFYDSKELKKVFKDLNDFTKIDNKLNILSDDSEKLDFKTNAAYWILYTIISKTLYVAQEYALTALIIAIRSACGDFTALASALVAIIASKTCQNTFNIFISDKVASEILQIKSMDTKQILFWVLVANKTQGNSNKLKKEVIIYES